MHDRHHHHRRLSYLVREFYCDTYRPVNERAVFCVSKKYKTIVTCTGIIVGRTRIKGFVQRLKKK